MDGHGSNCHQSLTRVVKAAGATKSAPASGNPMEHSVEQDGRRALIYGILSKLFDKPPDREFLDNLESSGIMKIMSRMAESPADVSHNVDLEQLNVEFTRLFLGPGRHVPPFASVHRPGNHSSGDLWDRTTGEVHRFMKYYGLSLSRPGAIPDHISVLFEFMEKVIRTKVNATRDSLPKPTRHDAIKKADDIQIRFFFTYISSWVDDFLAEVDRAQPHVFYETVVAFTRDFIEQERLVLLAES